MNFIKSIGSINNPNLKRFIKSLKKFINGSPQVNDWNPISEEFLFKLIESDNPIILDIGCNDGTHSLWFLEIFKGGKVYAFEPDPRAFKRFQDKVNDDRVKLFNLAITNADGLTNFYMSGGAPSQSSVGELSENWDLSSSTKKPKNHLIVHPWCTFEKTIEVEAKKLDTWFEASELDWIDLIWADVQGAERELIEGARETLKRTRFLYTEYNDFELYENQITLKKILEILPDFEAIKVYERDVLLRNKNLHSR